MFNNNQKVEFIKNSLNLGRLPLYAVILSAGLLSACSDDSVDGDAPVVPDQNSVEKVALTVGDGASQSGRVHFFGAPVSGRAMTDFETMPAAPSIPQSGVWTVDTPNALLNGNMPEGTTAIVITGGSDQIDIAKFGEIPVFITGIVTTHNIVGTSSKTSKIYIVNGGQLVCNNVNINNVSIYAYSDGASMDEPFYGGKDCTMNLGYDAQVYVGNDTKVVMKSAQIGGSSLFKAKGTFTIDSLKLTWGSTTYAKCMYATTVDADNGSELAIAEYANIATFKTNGGSPSLRLYPEAYFHVTSVLDLTGGWPTTIFQGTAGTDHGALVHAADKIDIKGGADSNYEKIRPAGVHFDYIKENIVDNEKAVTNPSSNWIYNMPAPETDYYISEKGCRPAHGTKPADAPEKPGFTDILVVDGRDHDHGTLSATGVQFNGNMAYLSFHYNTEYSDNSAEPSAFKGCVERYEISEENAQLEDWIMTSTQEFNHVYFDNALNRLIVAGEDNKGGFVGTIALSGGAFGQQTATIDIKRLLVPGEKLVAGYRPHTSGNCVVRGNDGKYYIAGMRGFWCTGSDLETEGAPYLSVGDRASAKHVAVQGNNLVLFNTANEDGSHGAANTQGDGVLRVYNSFTAFDAPAFDPKNVGTVNPCDGKNTVAIDGNTAYVCLGTNGIVAVDITNGSVKGSYKYAYQTGSKGNAAANGVAFDDKYVYIAYGGLGCVVLNKTDLSYIARYYDKKVERSANFVAVNGDLIYIAYGRNGFRVIKLENFPA